MRKWTWLALAALVTLSAVASAVTNRSVCTPACCDQDPPACCAADSCPK